tara:strand:+ start:59 stop:289 length:231 start_codon:yes stop_codon:yes gene_type:complete
MKDGAMFKAVWKGWTVGASVLFIPLFILVALFSPKPPLFIWLVIPMVPFIACLQGVLIGVLVCIGLKIWPIKETLS